MAEKILVKWQNNFSIGIKLIDDQHKELIRLTNKLFVSCLAGRERSMDVFLDTIHDVVDYTSYHFTTEEKVMERVNYPEYFKHKSEHVDFVREVYDRVAEFEPGKIVAPIKFVYFLRDWVLHHIAMSDRKMGEYLMNLSRSGELHTTILKVKKDAVSNRMQIC
ncbi:MAG: bacteriohemerythrin [Treponema sp.]|jgi:hemerythrin|nr:bacteriohemerythrin [Treponema sp.]